MAASGTTLFQPPLSDLLVEAFSRLGIRAPLLTAMHIIEGRRSMNLILQEWSGARPGPPLWAVDLQAIPLVPGIAVYSIPPDTINILDAYRRQYSPGTTVTTIGAQLTPVLTGGGAPIITSDGQPVVTSPSGTFSSVAGSPTITMTWLNHGQSVGNPIFFGTPITIGPTSIPGGSVAASGSPLARGTGTGFVAINAVPDINTVQFSLPASAVAPSTVTLLGGTPLFATTSGSPTVTVVLAQHGLSVGDTFTIQVATTVGGITLPVGNYTVASVPQSYEFTIAASANATSTTAAFENNGQINLTGQTGGVDPLDFVMTPLSRTEYSALPDKALQGLPTVFWLNRLQAPTASIWQVPPNGQFYAFCFYRWRALQDANPISGQTADLPNRWLPCFASSLTAALAEKFRPDLFDEKKALAEAAWERAAQEDVENTPLYVMPSLSSYYL